MHHTPLIYERKRKRPAIKHSQAQAQASMELDNLVNRAKERLKRVQGSRQQEIDLVSLWTIPSLKVVPRGKALQERVVSPSLMSCLDEAMSVGTTRRATTSITEMSMEQLYGSFEERSRQRAVKAGAGRTMTGPVRVPTTEKELRELGERMENDLRLYATEKDYSVGKPEDSFMAWCRTQSRINLHPFIPWSRATSLCAGPPRLSEKERRLATLQLKAENSLALKTVSSHSIFPPSNTITTANSIQRGGSESEGAEAPRRKVSLIIGRSTSAPTGHHRLSPP